MTLPAIAVLVAMAGYFAGSLPFGYLTARLVVGIDVRSRGSGNIGATNIGRVLGAKWGVLVLVLDCLKGLLPVVFAPLLLAEFAGSASQHLQVLCGLMTVVGHVFPVWLGFRGGKGVATALGVILGIGTWAVLAAFVAFLLTLMLFRIVSLSSLCAAVTFATVQMALLRPYPFAAETWSVAAFSLMVPALIVWRHRTNIVRILRGEEERFGFAAKEETQGNGDTPGAAADAPDLAAGGKGARLDSAVGEQLTKPSDG
ncbi:MAG: glycerol-3-phosphate 1-O-acyltransferase PlsY [Planctomycetaceae bacterium]